MTLSLSGAERQAFGQLYLIADPNNTGMISGDAAVKFFEGFKLPTLTLGQIWSKAMAWFAPSCGLFACGSASAVNVRKTHA